MKLLPKEQKSFVSIKVIYYNGSNLIDQYQIFGLSGDKIPKRLLGLDKYNDTWNQIPTEFPTEDKELIIFTEGEDNMKYEVEFVKKPNRYKKEIAIGTSALALIGATVLIRHIFKNKE